MKTVAKPPSLRLSYCSCHLGDDSSLGTAVVEMANSIIISMPAMGVMHSACHGSQITALCMALERMLEEYEDREQGERVLKESRDAARSYIEFCRRVQSMGETQGSA